jgi:hypothetical protein
MREAQEKKIQAIEEVARKGRAKRIYTRTSRLHGAVLPRQQVRRLAQTYREQYELATRLLEVAQLLPPARRELFLVVGQHLDNALRVLADKMLRAKSEKVQVDAAYRILRTVEAITANVSQTNILVNIDNAEMAQKVEEYKRMLMEYIARNTANNTNEDRCPPKDVCPKTEAQEAQFAQDSIVGHGERHRKGAREGVGLENGESGEEDCA